MTTTVVANLLYTRCLSGTEKWDQFEARHLAIHLGETARCEVTAPTVWYTAPRTEEYPHHMDAQSKVVNIRSRPDNRPDDERYELVHIPPLLNQVVSFYSEAEHPLDRLSYYVGLDRQRLAGPQPSRNWKEYRLSWLHIPVQTRDDGSHYLELPEQTLNALDEAGAALPIAVPLTGCRLPRRLMIPSWMAADQRPAGYEPAFAHDVEAEVVDEALFPILEGGRVIGSDWETWVRVAEEPTDSTVA